MISEITYDTSTLAIEAGQSTTLACSVSNPDDLDIPVEVQWMKVRVEFIEFAMFVSFRVFSKIPVPVLDNTCFMLFSCR